MKENNLEIKYINPSKLMPYLGNPRLNEQAIEPVKKSIEHFGFVNPIIARKSDNMIIAGHTRWKAALKANLKEVPVIFVDLSENDSKLYNLTDNKLSELAEWDIPGLENILGELKLLDVDISLAGFGDYDLSGMNEGLTDPDDVPEPPEEPVTKKGDLWLLGNHRLMCGDSIDAGAVTLLMNGKKASLIATDPPYGVAYGDETGNVGKFKKMANDENDGLKLQYFLENVFSTWSVWLKDNAAWYLWHAQMTQGFFAAAAAAAAADIIIHRQIIWIKPSLILGHGHYHWKHELCFYGWKQGFMAPWYGDRKQTTVWEISRENDYIHPTQKPIEIFIKPMNFNTKKGEICAEPFLGSGSQIIASEQTNRICYAMEIDEHYCDVSVIRWQNFTGKQAIREADGVLFDDEAKNAKVSS